MLIPGFWTIPSWELECRLQIIQDCTQIFILIIKYALFLLVHVNARVDEAKSYELVFSKIHSNVVLKLSMISISLWKNMKQKFFGKFPKKNRPTFTKSKCVFFLKKIMAKKFVFEKRKKEN
jgi:hypothetical protein